MAKKFREYQARVKVKMAMPLLLKMAREIDKEDFLKQLKEQWKPYVKKSMTNDEQMKAVEKRIKLSGLQKAFDVAGITTEDIKRVLQEIRDENTTTTVG